MNGIAAFVHDHRSCRKFFSQRKVVRREDAAVLDEDAYTFFFFDARAGV